MDIPTETLQAFLDDAWDASQPNSIPLRDQLRNYEKAATKLFSAGSIASVSKNSASQAYRGPGLGSFTPGQIQTAWRTLINLFDQTVEWINHLLALVPVPSWAPPDTSDTSVYVAMKKGLVVITGVSTDMTDLYLTPSRAPGGLVAW